MPLPRPSATTAPVRPSRRAEFLERIADRDRGARRRADRARHGRNRLAGRAHHRRARTHLRAAAPVRAGGARRLVGGCAHRSGAARPPAAAAPGSPAHAQGHRSGGGVRVQQLSAGVLHCRRGYRLGIRRGLQRGRQGASRAPGYRRTGGRCHCARGSGLRIASRRVLDDPRRRRHCRHGDGAASGDRGGRLHRVARRGSGAVRRGCRARHSPSRCSPR